MVLECCLEGVEVIRKRYLNDKTASYQLLYVVYGYTGAVSVVRVHGYCCTYQTQTHDGSRHPGLHTCSCSRVL